MRSQVLLHGACKAAGCPVAEFMQEVAMRHDIGIAEAVRVEAAAIRMLEK